MPTEYLVLLDDLARIMLVSYDGKLIRDFDAEFRSRF